MKIKKLKLSNFRSYQEREFNFKPKVTLIIGPNGSGKTNLIEAIYLLGFTRSFRGAPQQLAHKGDDWFRVSAELDKTNETALSWNKGVKKITYNQQETTPGEFIGTMPVVLFEPGSLQTIYGAPKERRRLLDRILAFSDEKYLKSLLQLRRILKQRNSLLRQKTLNKDEIFGWDVLLVEQAAYIRQQREKLVKYLNQKTPKIYQAIANTKDKIKLEYISKTDSESYNDQLLAQLARMIEVDYRYGNTSVGPHRDDVAVLYNKRPLVEVGSRGEIRTAVVALVLAELEYLKKHAKNPPVLLLDDVFSELDESRQAALLNNIGDTQTFITTTEIPATLKNSYTKIEL